MSDMGPLRYFLGLEMSCMLEGNQDVLARAHLSIQCIVDTPMELVGHPQPIDSEPLEDRN